MFWRGYSYFLRVTIYENLHNKGNCDRKFNGNITQLLIAWAAGKGGIGLAATRLVYSEGEEQISLGVRNTSPDVPYLIQSWVMTPDNKKSADFIITPPLFVLNPANENLLRIMYIGAPLAKDRETLFFTSVRAVPSTTKRKEGNTLKIATQSVIKLFWRPKGLGKVRTSS